MNNKDLYFRWIKNCTIVIISIIFALIVSEITLRVVFPDTPTFDSYFPRYVIDGRPSYVSGITVDDPLMPFAMKPDYSHMFTDLAYHPEPYKITLDGDGFRNSTDYSHYDNVIAGDSVAYGAGVDDDKILSAILGKTGKVYNLAISGAGPGMYMKMIDTFLKKRKTDKITIIFFLGNDLRNLQGACWDEMAECKPPLAGKIRRTDVSADPVSPPLWLSLPLLRKSVLAQYIYMFTKDEKVDNGNSKLNKLFSMISKKAVADIKSYLTLDNLLKSNKHNAIKLLNELLVSECIDNETVILINEIISDIQNDNIDNIFAKTKRVTRFFINANCYPIGSGMQNVVSYANYFAGFYYESLNAISSGYTGNLDNYIQILKMVANTFSDLKEEAENLIHDVIDLKDLEKIELCTNGLQQKLNYKTEDDSCLIAENCDKLDIFLEFLVSLQAKDIKVAMYLIPAEYQLNGRSRHKEREHSLCSRAIEAGIDCLDLTPQFLEHYSNRKNNSLFLDGAHLTIDGNETVAKWITKYENR